MLAKCLERQSFEDWEWIIAAPQDLLIPIDRQVGHEIDFVFVPEPLKREGDYYRLCGAWNEAFKKARGRLIVSIQDGIWFPPDTLYRLWAHYLHNPKGLIGMIGHQYEQVVNNKPEGIIWQDPRSRTDMGTFYEVAPSEIEFSMCSLPKQAVLDCGGIDEEYDRGAAVGEKEMCWRLDKLGYKFYLDQTLEYRALRHPRLTTDWDEKYKISSEIFIRHMAEREAGTRTLKLPYLE